MIEAEWWEYDDADELADAVAGDVGFILDSAIDARGSALIAVPGGTTPGPALAKLAAQKRDWKRVTIIPTDDRLVPMGDTLSNVTAIARLFLPKGARVVPLTSEKAPDVKAAGRAADAVLQDLPWPPDLVWLGVGADGHTASIFPGPDFDEAINGPKERRALGVTPEPLPKEAPVPRVTLSRSAIVGARTLIITCVGDKKRAVLEQAIEQGAAGTTPIARVLAECELPVDIHWASDATA